MADEKRGALAKLIIHSFPTNKFSIPDEKFKFVTPINPETFTKTRNIRLEKTQGHGQAGTDLKYISTAPEELKIEFTLDGTASLEGYVEKYKTMEVSAQIKALSDCVYQFDGEIHRPRFLIVQWGSELNLHCVLSNMDIIYSLFKSDGNPLRAKITATFVEYKNETKILAEQRNGSPDMTHFRIVKQGDRLDNMTYDIYNDSKYFLQVAKIKGLTSTRKIKPGTEIYFPPINKNEE